LLDSAVYNLLDTVLAYESLDTMHRPKGLNKNVLMQALGECVGMPDVP